MLRRHALLFFVAALVLVVTMSPVQAVRVDESTLYVENNSSDVDTHADHGTESSFLAMQAGPDSSFDTLTEANTGGSTSTSKLPTANTAGTYPWTNPTNVYTEDTSYATATSTIPTFRAAGTMGHSTTSTFTPGLPSGTAANDILILYGVTYTGGTLTITAAGSVTWNAMTGSPVDVAVGDKLYVWWGRYSSGSTGPTLQASADHGLGRILGFYNCYTGGSPIDVSAVGTETTSDTTMSFATGLTTTYNNELCVSVFSTTYDPTSDTTAAFSAEANTNLASVTERSDNDVNEGNGGGAGSCTGTRVTAGAMGTFTATYAYASPKAYMAFALRSTVPNNAFDHVFGTFGITGSGTITAVEIGYEAYSGVSGEKLDLYTSENGGSSWHTVHTTAGLGTSDPGAYTYIDATADTTWTWTLLNDANFKYKVVSNWVSATPVWYLDALIVRVTYSPTNYEMDVEFQWTTADFDETVEELAVYCGTQDAEALILQVRNSGAWTTLVADLVASAWNNVSIAPYLTTTTLTIRFLGGTESSDAVQSAWQIDCALIHVYSTAYSQSGNEVLPVSDQVTASRLVSKSLSDALGLTDLIGKGLIAARAFGESIALGSSVNTVLTAVLIMSQVLGMVAASTTSKTAIQTLLETLPVLESMGRSATITRGLGEAFLMQNSSTQDLGWMTTTDPPGGGGGDNGGGGSDDPGPDDLVSGIVAAGLIVVGLFAILFVFARGSVAAVMRNAVRVCRFVLFLGLCVGTIVFAFTLNDLLVTSLVGEWLNTVFGFNLFSVTVSLTASFALLMGLLYVSFWALWRFRRLIIG